MARAARAGMRGGYRPLGHSVGPVEDVMLAACQFVALPRNQVRADDLRRALGRVSIGQSPKLDTVIERAGLALADPADGEARRALLSAARDLKGVRLAPPGEQWWDR